MRRRSFLQIGAWAASGLKPPAVWPATPANGARKKIAVVAASYVVHSPTDNIVSRLLDGYWISDEFHPPACDVVSLYLQQRGPSDVGHRTADSYGVRFATSVADALTMGAGKLAVDGVVLAGDVINPVASPPDWRFSFFRQVVDAYRQLGGSAPVFIYGCLSPDWSHALQVYRWSRELGFPLMAGSSPPVTFRRPPVDYHLPDNYDDTRLGDRGPQHYPLGVDFDSALVVSPGDEAAMFCGLEILQSYLERRRAGETGIRSLERLTGEPVWRAAQQGRWSSDLMRAALARVENPGESRPEKVAPPDLWLIEYRDGTQGAVLALGGWLKDYVAAFRLKGRHEIDSLLFYTPPGSRNDFSMLVHGIETLMTTGVSPIPVERTLLAGGAFAHGRAAAQAASRRVETPDLMIAYAAPERSFYAPGEGW